MSKFVLNLRMTSALLTSVRQYICSTRMSHYVSHSMLARYTFSTRQTVLTSCNWRYLKQTFRTANNFIQSNNTQWYLNQTFRTVNNFVQSNNTRWSRGSAGQSTSCVSGERVAAVLEKYHHLMETGCFLPEHVVEFSTSLQSAVYSDLSHLPWLHYNNIQVSYMQLCMNNKVEDLLKLPLYAHEHIHSLICHIDGLVDEIPGQDCPSILLSFTYSGLDLSEPCQHKLLAKCYDSLPDYSSHQLIDLTYILRAHHRRNFILAEGILGWLSQALNDDISCVPIELRDLCIFTYMLTTFMSKNMIHKCCTAIEILLQKQSPHMDIDTIFWFHKVFENFYFEHLNVDLCCSLILAALENMDFSQLSCSKLAIVGFWFRGFKRFTSLRAFSSSTLARDCIDKAQARALQLLNGGDNDLLIRDTTYLLYVFFDKASPSLKQTLQQMLLDQLPDCDVYTLSGVAENISHLGLDDFHLQSLLQEQVLRNIGCIMDNNTALRKVIGVLYRMHCDARFSQEMCVALLVMLEKGHGYNKHQLIQATKFLMKNVGSMIPSILMKNLLTNIPLFKSMHLVFIYCFLNRKDLDQWTVHNQIAELKTCIRHHLVKKLQTPDYSINRGELEVMLHHSGMQSSEGLFDDMAVFDSLMNQCVKVFTSLNRTQALSVRRIVQLSYQPYYYPDVFELLIDFTMKNCSSSFHDVLKLALVLSRSGYHPENFDQFSAFMSQVLEDWMSSTKSAASFQMVLAHNLTLLGIFPDHCLGQIFSFGFLEKLDKQLEGLSKEDVHRFTLMKLNRTMVIECPHLDIPWFLQELGQKYFEAAPFSNRKDLHLLNEGEGASLKDVIETVLPPKYLSEFGLTPYYHLIPYQLVLDSEGSPVEFKDWDKLQPGHQRVALTTTGVFNLCKNTPHRQGFYQQNLRHMEILGYRTEEISSQDWYSEDLNRFEDKVDFVRRKIFSQR